ncbi:M15 family metallopeptidase [Kineococcus sp. SYSU DK002]|uniref:M15 family metallopeptidase n=1 Tax=Kineococcus sp. SYSU DK002 TaxID=3383123 RepID=UPI003D7E9613
MLSEKTLPRPPVRPVTRALWALPAGLLAAGVAVAVLHGGGAPDDGRVGDARVTVGDTGHPAVARLDPALREALGAAGAAAAADGVEVLVTSGWRSREYQAELLRDAVQRYGSREEAARWVATPDASRHVRGEAVDVGPTGAAYWMAEHGARFGLCQVYANEVWHYELLTVPGGTCPPLRADAAG